MGFGGGGETAPTGDFSGAPKTGTYTEKLIFGPFSKDTKPTDIKIVIQNGTNSVTYTFSNDSSPQELTHQGDIAGISYVNYTDLAGDSKISSGDYLTITFASPGSGSYTYTVSIVYVPTGDVIGDITFSW